MLTELVYLAAGLSRRVDKIMDSLIEEGKKELESKSLLDIPKEHLQKRKEMVENLFKEDAKKVADRLGLATKDDIEEIKELLQSVVKG